MLLFYFFKNYIIKSETRRTALRMKVTFTTYNAPVTGLTDSTIFYAELLFKRPGLYGTTLKLERRPPLGQKKSGMSCGGKKAYNSLPLIIYKKNIFLSISSDGKNEKNLFIFIERQAQRGGRRDTFFI
jgi:hypothetical protein